LKTRILILVIALGANVVTALGVVYARHESRHLSVRLGALEQVRDEAVAEWSRLQIEQAYLADAGNVELQARRELGMVSPDRSRILMIRHGPDTAGPSAGSPP
jgi:cell division protein FtsL